MGFFDIFKRRKFDNFEDDENENEEKKEAEVEPEVSISGQRDIKICKPKNFQQSLSAVDCLVNGKTVFLDLENMDKDVYHRVIDFVSGAAYALDLSIKKATNDSYIIAPKDVDISGEAFETADEDEEFFTL